MELREAIMGRRSVRKYKPDPIPKQLLQEIIDLALWAPSPMNRQDSSLIVVQGDQKKDLLKISSGTFELFRPVLEKQFADKPKIIEGMKTFFETYGGAPVIILAYAGKLPTGQDDLCGAAMVVQNLLLAAHGAGLGACWTDGAIFYKESEFNDLFGMAGKQLVSIVPIGYSDEEPRIPARRQGRVTWLGFES